MRKLGKGCGKRAKDRESNAKGHQVHHDPKSAHPWREMTRDNAESGPTVIKKAKIRRGGRRIPTCVSSGAARAIRLSENEGVLYQTHEAGQTVKSMV
jgi:hypothetical protein